MDLDPDKDDYVAVRKRVIKQMSNFAKGYRGLWQWKFGWGQNCHTFQQAMKKSVGMHYQKGDGWFLRPPGVEGIYDTITKRRQQKWDARQEADWQQRHAGTEYVLHKEVSMRVGGTGEVDAPERTAPAGTILRVLNDQNGQDVNTFNDMRYVEVIWGKDYYNLPLGELKASGTVKPDEGLLLSPNDVPQTDNPGFRILNE
jgi:hypothetical protein